MPLKQAIDEYALNLQGIAKTVTKQRIESHFDLELRAAVMVRFPWKACTVPASLSLLHLMLHCIMRRIICSSHASVLTRSTTSWT